MKRQCDTLDKVLEVTAAFDWITPLASLFSADVRLCVHWDAQNDADDTLRSAGIDQKRSMLLGEYYSFDVDKSAAKDALKALSRAGVSAWRS